MPPGVQVIMIIIIEKYNILTYFYFFPLYYINIILLSNI